MQDSPEKNIKLTISYDGTEFFGWQTQPGKRTVQETIEKAIEKITGHEAKLMGSGRTDSGVHALGQVANFKTRSTIETTRIAMALNSYLPEDVSILEAEDVNICFDANRSAISKTYRYVIRCSRATDPFSRKYAHTVKYSLDEEKMRVAATALLGTHDFQCFETDWPNRATSIRNIHKAIISRMGDWIWITVEADGFLYNMVRAIVGSLIEIGRGFWPVEKMEQIIASRNRNHAGPTAPAKGLYLLKVNYDKIHE
ncbi:MAG: tRNA pseudouridine(38-40) synthase TruA [Planctomycetota bacterium]|jgi:tRNA pseudouridine38-40 synthase